MLYRLGLNPETCLFHVDFFWVGDFTKRLAQPQELLRFGWNSPCCGLRGGVPFSLCPWDLQPLLPFPQAGLQTPAHGLLKRLVSHITFGSPSGFFSLNFKEGFDFKIKPRSGRSRAPAF